MISLVLRALVMAVVSVILEVGTAVTDVPAQEIIEPVVEAPAYSEDDLYWLSRVIYAESGADYCSDELQLAVGSVVLNRVKSDLYPDSIKEVIFDSEHDTQYGCTLNGMIYLEPNKRAIENAKNLLINGSQLPSNVLGQAHTNTLNQIYTIIDGVVFSSL